ncbi:MAG: polymer-forming cytoskeletal protein [Anaerolineaceae bacterium]|nr:polymer-forming cytoskeletal protein [Anaerolineaceae bacterium]
MKLFQQKSFKIISIMLIIVILLIFKNQTIYAENPSVESNLGPGEEVFDDLFLQGSEVLVEGHVHGMLFAIGEKIVIQSGAQIENDIYLLGKSITIEDNVVVAGNLFVGGQNVVIRAPINRNLVVAAATLELRPMADIGRNLFFGGFHLNQFKVSTIMDNLYAACYQISVNGTIEKNLRVSAVSVQLSGDVKGNAEIAIDASGDDEGIRIWLPYMQQLNIPDLLPTGLVVGDKASINGQLIYTSAKNLEENLRNLPLQGVVENIYDSESSQFNADRKVVTKNPFVLRIFRMIRQLVGLLFFAVISWKFGKRYISESSQIAISKPVNSLGVGFLSILVVYLGALVALILICLIAIVLGVFTLNQLSSLLFFIGIAVIILSLTVFGILAMYVSKFVLAYWVGGFVLNKFKFGGKNKEVWSLVTGIVLYIILSAIPVFGWIMGVLVSLIGIGAIWYTLQKHDEAGILPDFE